MNEKSKLYIILGIVGVIVLGVTALLLFNKGQGKKIVESFDKAFASKEEKIVYIMQDGCSACEAHAPVIEKVKKDYKIDILEINTKDLSNEQLVYILNKLEVDTSDFGTPYMVTVKDSKKVSDKKGYNEFEELFGYLKERGFIAKEEVLPLTYIDFKQYKEILASGTKEVIVVGQTGCGACTAAKPILEKIVKDHGIKINYIDARKLTEEENAEFTKSLAYLNEKEWGTPLMLVVENNATVNVVEGLNTEAGYVEFLKTNGIIK